MVGGTDLLCWLGRSRRRLRDRFRGCIGRHPLDVVRGEHAVRTIVLARVPALAGVIDTVHGDDVAFVEVQLVLLLAGEVVGGLGNDEGHVIGGENSLLAFDAASDPTFARIVHLGTAVTSAGGEDGGHLLLTYRLAKASQQRCPGDVRALTFVTVRSASLAKLRSSSSSPSKSCKALANLGAIVVQAEQGPRLPPGGGKLRQSGRSQAGAALADLGVGIVVHSPREGIVRCYMHRDAT